MKSDTSMKSNPIIIKKASGPGVGGRGARVAIPGVFPSTSRFGEQVVKFRVNSLDAFIGGGVPVGSICIIREEFPSQYGDMLLKSFVADGSTYNHRIYIASAHLQPDTFARSLPSIKKTPDPGDDSATADLKIAWRYGHSQQESGGAGGMKLKGPDQNQTCFDFSKKASVEDLGGKNLYLSACYDEESLQSSRSTNKGNEILREVLNVVDGLALEESSKPPSNVARIAISHCEEDVLSDNFLLKLRSIVQHTNSCAVITLSDMAHPVNKSNSSLLTRAEHFADIVISLRNIVDQKRRNELGGIDGVCCIKKAASNNTLRIFEPPKDIGFSFKKKRLLFHELHLPPEGENTTQREVSSSSSKTVGVSSASGGGGSCGSTWKGKSIDF